MAEELCLRAGIEKEFPTRYLDDDQVQRLYAAYQGIIEDARSRSDPIIDQRGVLAV